MLSRMTKTSGLERAVRNAARYLLKKQRKQQQEQAAAVRQALLVEQPQQPLEQVQTALEQTGLCLDSHQTTCRSNGCAPSYD